jgi:hypothetical protein
VSIALTDHIAQQDDIIESKIAATPQAETKMARDGFSSPVATKRRKLDDGAETVIILSSMLSNGLLTST